MPKMPIRCVLIALVAALALVCSACASTPDQSDDARAAAQPTDTPHTAEPPSPEELAKTPCGNPDWAQLPPGARPDHEEPAPDAPGDEPAPDAPDDQEPSDVDGEQEDARLGGQDLPPCT